MLRWVVHILSIWLSRINVGTGVSQSRYSAAKPGRSPLPIAYSYSLPNTLLPSRLRTWRKHERVMLDKLAAKILLSTPVTNVVSLTLSQASPFLIN